MFKIRKLRSRSWARCRVLASTFFIIVHYYWKEILSVSFLLITFCVKVYSTSRREADRAISRIRDYFEADFGKLIF